MAVDDAGKEVPPPQPVPEDELRKFMQTPEGEEYYAKWLKGDITCRMVRERSGCGLLAKFFSRKTDEEEDQKMLDAAMEAERVEQSLPERKGCQVSCEDGVERAAEGVKGNAAGQGQGRDGGQGQALQVDSDRGDAPELPSGSDCRAEHARGSEKGREELAAPTVWPSYVLRPCADTLQLESQESGADNDQVVNTKKEDQKKQSLRRTIRESWTSR